jgi:hypothetical protein
MSTAIKSIGIVLGAVAILYLLRPQALRRIFEFFRKGRRLYFAGLIRFALAVVFLLGARECRMFWVIFALGILFMLSGLLIFVMPLEKLKAIINWYQKRPLLLLRVMALIILALAVLVIYAA